MKGWLGIGVLGVVTAVTIVVVRTPQADTAPALTQQAIASTKPSIRLPELPAAIPAKQPVATPAPAAEPVETATNEPQLNAQEAQMLIQLMADQRPRRPAQSSPGPTQTPQTGLRCATGRPSPIQRLRGATNPRPTYGLRRRRAADPRHPRTYRTSRPVRRTQPSRTRRSPRGTGTTGNAAEQTAEGEAGAATEPTNAALKHSKVPSLSRLKPCVELID